MRLGMGAVGISLNDLGENSAPGKISDMNEGGESGSPHSFITEEGVCVFEVMAMTWWLFPQLY